VNIVIVGAGTVGQYVASFLAGKENNVVLVDTNLHHLEQISQQLDVAVRHGSGTDWEVLEELSEMNPNLLLALTDNDESNMVACSIAKNLGYPKTVARVRNASYLNRTRLDFGRLFCVDHFICSEHLVAQDIFNYATESGAVAIHSFAHGAVQLRTFVVPTSWRNRNKKICDLDLPEGIVVGFICRSSLVNVKGKKRDNKEMIFPHGEDYILPGDEITIIGETEDVLKINPYFGISRGVAKSVVIVGGTLTGQYLARVLDQHGIRVKIIDQSYDRCLKLAEQLPWCTVLHHDATDIDFLRSECVDSSDLFVVCTGRDEVNILAGGLAKEVGCENVIVSISDSWHMPIVDRMGIAHTISPRISAGNRIFTIACTETVASMVSLYEDQAEILEIKVSLDSQIVGIPIAELAPSLPRNFLFAVIQNRGRILIANGNRILSPGDTVIVISDPKHIEGLRKIF